jgi:hypothetical protein
VVLALHRECEGPDPARYGSHGGYVSAYIAATNALVDDRLWDATLGNLYVRQAAGSSILR